MNSDNLGVGALTLSNIAIVSAAAERAGVTPRFVVLGWTDPRPHYEQRPGVEVVGLRMKDFVRPTGGLFSHLRRCDLVLDIGAGDSFADIYGPRRFAVLLASKILTLLARRPLVLSPQTIGPFARPWVRRAAVQVMRRASAVTTRDDLSTAFLREIGYDGPVIEASDVALRLPFTAPDRRPEGPLRIGLNVSGLLFNGGYTRDNMFGLAAAYPEVIRALLSRLLARGDCEVHLVPHVISDEIEVEDDYRASARLCEEFPELILAPKFAGPSEAKSYIAGLDFFAGARMHACIAAFSSGVPVLPMAYSRKFAGLFGSLGYEALIDCRADDQATVLAKFDAALADRARLQAEVKTGLAAGLARLARYEDALALQLGAPAEAAA